MAKSLQQQLLEAGALDKGRAQKLKKQKHKQTKQRVRGAQTDDAIKQAAARTAAEKATRDRSLSRERQAAAEAKAITAQIRQLIEANRIERAEGDIAYHFSDNKVVKSLDVDAGLHRQLVLGRVAIVRLDKAYEVVAEPVATKIAQRDPGCVVVLNSPGEETVDDDDTYADYKIPDDLNW